MYDTVSILARRRLLCLLLLFCALGLLDALAGSAARAAPITGMIGVGTWNTQADFTGVKVVQGATTLYQSDFAAGMSGWKTQGGTWSTTADGLLHQAGGDMPALALVGDPTWSNYTVTLRARKTGGAEGFLIAFGSPGDATTTWWNIGGWGNTLSALQVPGVYFASVPAAVQTGVWYDIRIEVIGSDVRCYFNGTLVHDTARILDSGDRASRFQALKSSSGFGLINPWEQGWLNDLAGRSVYIGDAARETISAMPSTTTFKTLTATQQATIIRKVNRNRLTWNTGGGFGSDPGRDAAIIGSMDASVILHNQLGLFDGQMTANNSPGTSTADASYGGWINFGSQYNERTALHEISHALGTGTFWKWYNPAANAYGILNGLWQGFYANTQLDAFDGAGAVLHGDTQHYWPYGLNYDNEWSDVNAARHVLLVRALQRDMGISTLDVQGSTDIANGTYALVPRDVPGSVLDVQNGGTAAGTPIDIHAYTEADSQKFLLDLQSDGTYRIRTTLAGNRALDLTNWDTSNGNKLQIWDDNGLDPQRWYIIPTGDGWYRIAPKLNIYKGLDVLGFGTADGTLIDDWDYLDGLNQQWKLVPSSDLYTTKVPSGTYVLTPQNAPGSVLDVQNAGTVAGTPIDIHGYTGSDAQKFLLDLQSDGTYRIRTALAGNRALDLTNWDTTNGNKLELWDDNGLDPQRWYLIPVQNGWYKIAPKLNIDKSIDVLGFGTADGTPVDNWDYLGGTNQLWHLAPPPNPAPAVTSLSPAKTIAGSGPFTLAVTGTGFLSSSTVLWNGSALVTTFVSATQLTATVPASAVAVPASAQVSVSTPVPGGGTSGPLPFLAALPSLKYVGATVIRRGTDLAVTVTLSNTGPVDATAVSVTVASMTLGGKTLAATGLPASAGTIPASGTGTVAVLFPGSGTLAGAAAIRLSGTFASVGVFSVNGPGDCPSVTRHRTGPGLFTPAPEA